MSSRYHVSPERARLVFEVLLVGFDDDFWVVTINNTADQIAHGAERLVSGGVESLS
jgi:hypothetical protein